MCDLMAGDAADRGEPVLGDRPHEARVRRGRRGGRVASSSSQERLEREARPIHDEDVASCRAMGALRRRAGARRRPRPHALQRRRAGDGRLRHGARRHPRRGRAGQAGRACSPTRRARSCRARGSPRGSCVRDGIDTTVITDNMAGPLMRDGEIDLVVVGADRIAANGDTANKIGTYTVAVLAHEHDIPFYVAAPLSTDRPRDARRLAHPDRGARPARGDAPADPATHAGRRAHPQPGVRRDAAPLHRRASSPNAASSGRRTPRSLRAACSTAGCTGAGADSRHSRPHA